MRQVAHVLLTRPPLNPFPKELHSLDLHVLGTPPAFVLSQDQTLNKKFNLLLKLLWVFIRLKRIAGFILTIFCSIFKDHFLSQLSLLLFVFFCHTQATHLVYHLIWIMSTTFSKLFNLLLFSNFKALFLLFTAPCDVFYLITYIKVIIYHFYWYARIIFTFL